MRNNGGEEKATQRELKDSAGRELVIHGIYRHFKDDSYLVEDVCTHSETKETLVLY